MLTESTIRTMIRIAVEARTDETGVCDQDAFLDSEAYETAHNNGWDDEAIMMCGSEFCNDWA